MTLFRGTTAAGGLCLQTQTDSPPAGVFDLSDSATGSNQVTGSLAGNTGVGAAAKIYQIVPTSSAGSLSSATAANVGLANNKGWQIPTVAGMGGSSSMRRVIRAGTNVSFNTYVFNANSTLGATCTFTAIGYKRAVGGALTQVCAASNTFTIAAASVNTVIGGVGAGTGGTIASDIFFNTGETFYFEYYYTIPGELVTADSFAVNLNSTTLASNQIVIFGTNGINFIPLTSQAGAIAPSATLIKTYSKNITGGITSSGVNVKTPKKSMIGTLGAPSFVGGTTTLTAVARSGSPDTDSWGDTWTDNTVGNTGNNHGSDTALTVSNVGLAKYAWIEVDLTGYSGTASGSHTFSFSWTDASAGSTVIVNFYTKDIRPFIESTLSTDNANFVGITDIGNSVQNTGAGTTRITATFTDDQMQQMFGKWLLVEIYGGGNAAQGTVASREAATNQPVLTFTRASTTGSVLSGSLVKTPKKRMYGATSWYVNLMAPYTTGTGGWVLSDVGMTLATGVLDPQGGTTAFSITYPAGTGNAVAKSPIPPTQATTSYTIRGWIRSADGSSVNFRWSYEDYGPAGNFGSYDLHTATGVWTQFTKTFTSSSIPRAAILIYSFTGEAANKTLQVWGLEMVPTYIGNRQLLKTALKKFTTGNVVIPSATLIKVDKKLAGSATPSSGSLLRKPVKVLLGFISPVGNQTTKVLNAVTRSGTPDADSWGDSWTDATVGNTGANHGNEHLDIANPATATEHRGFIEVDLTAYAGQTAVGGSHYFGCQTSSGQSVSQTLSFLFGAQATRPFVESTITQANQPASPTLFSKSITVPATSGQWANFVLSDAEMQQLLGKWVLIVVAQSVGSPGVGVNSREEVSPPQFTFTSGTTFGSPTSGTLVKTIFKRFIIGNVVTPSAVLLKTPKKFLVSSTASSGSLIRTPLKVLLSATASVGALIKKPSKFFGGTVTPTGTEKTTVVKHLFGFLYGPAGSGGAISKIIQWVLSDD